MTQLYELFALPIGLQKVMTIDGIPLYGSKTLNDKLIKSVINSENGKVMEDFIEDLVKKEIIIPCFADSNIIKYFRRKISNDKSSGLIRLLKVFSFGKTISHPLDFVLAFYHPDENKVVIMINNNMDKGLSSTMSDESISLALIHELVHMYSHYNPNEFISLFKDELNLYYSNLFNEIFKVKDKKIPEKVVNSVYNYLFFECERTSKVSSKGIYKQLQNIKPYSSLDNKEFQKVSMDYLTVVRLYLTSETMEKFFQSVKTDYKHILLPVFKAYKKSFGRIPEKGCAYEIIYPSEVIAGLADIKRTPKIKQAIKSLV